jgi:hypothetical protein
VALAFAAASLRQVLPPLRLPCGLTTALLLALADPAIRAQAPDPPRPRPDWYAVSVGPFITPGELWGVAHVGFLVGASAGITPVRVPVGVRLDASFASSTLRTRRGPDESEAGDLAIYSANLAPLVYLKRVAGMRPYLFASGGMGRAHLVGLDTLGGRRVPDRVVTRPLFGGGAGVQLRRGGLGGFVEVRYQRMTIPAVVQFVPFIIGLEL